MVVSMDRWVGKVAVVTGASSGIGAAIATKLVEAGVIVVGVARRKNLIEQTAKSLEGKKGKLHAFSADLTKEEEAKKVFKWTSDNVGPVSILVNGAGRFGPPNTFFDGPSENWKPILDINVLGLCYVTKEAVTIMRANKIDGHVINMNSILGHSVPVHVGCTMYPTSKYAVTALSEIFRLEVIKDNLKIKITSISAGAADTPLFTEEQRKTKSFQDSIGDRMLTSEDIADAVLFALSTPPKVEIFDIVIKPLNELA
ncbi:farnesol dehydrogenase-like [Diorhabda sublineata]|uniref:farnesol dehydrogenase-like n=1 Tax=Diorhabda sublineata TaxID=1163346 RepID=UPI0024E06AAC|nr:farnesol dehydrogenase-like [Diorhabda sublineata]